MREYFGVLRDGTAVEKITLVSGTMSCTVLTYGAVLQSLTVPDRNGNMRDIALGYDTVNEYAADDGYLGAIVGRYANRIANGRFSIDGKEYILTCNNGSNHIHGGAKGFSMRIWTVEKWTEDSVALSLDSSDGEEGYPGDLHAAVCYTLANDMLHIDYEAISSKDTVCNLTNHTYFNLAGHNSGSAADQELQIFASRYTPGDATGLPVGVFAQVADTPMDFRVPTRLGAHIEDDFEQLKLAGGYDHNFALNEQGRTLHPAARAYCRESGIEMFVRTTMPGLQLYTANGLTERRGKDGAVYAPRHAFCLETEYFPNSPNESQFPSPVLRAGQKFAHTTTYSFLTI